MPDSSVSQHGASDNECPKCGQPGCVVNDEQGHECLACGATLSQSGDSAREPSVIRERGYQGSSDPGEPTMLMQHQTQPVSRPGDSVGRADAQESIRRAAEAQMDRWDGKTVEEVRDEWMCRAKDRLNQIIELEAERDRYRKALEEIAGHFVPHKRKTYGPVDIALDAIRREVEEALADD